jgi:CheY-like chemotaxis protein
MPVPVAPVSQGDEPVVSGDEAALRGLRVLVVEDIAVLAWRMRDVLEQAGAEVVGPAPDVPRALALLDAHEVDAAVLDLNLDGKPADPVADVLAARDVPFLFVTGYGSGSAEGRHAGRPTLGKPVKPPALVQALAAFGVRPASRE